MYVFHFRHEFQHEDYLDHLDIYHVLLLAVELYGRNHY